MGGVEQGSIDAEEESRTQRPQPRAQLDVDRQQGQSNHWGQMAAAAAAAPHPAPRCWSRRVSSSHAATTTMAATIAATMAAPASSQLQPPHPAAGAPAFCGAPLRLRRPTRARGARTSPRRDRAAPRPSSHSCERARPPGSAPRSTSSAAATPSGRSSRGCRRRRRCRRHSRPSICPSRVCPWGQKTRAADAPGGQGPPRAVFGS